MRLAKLATLLATAPLIAFAASTARGLGPRPQVEPRGRGAEKGQPLRGPDPTSSSGDGTGAAAGDSARERKQRGVALGLFAEDVSFSYVPLLREIAALGATHVALVVPLYQTDGRSTDLALHTRFSPTLELVADTIRAAKRERLEVTLFPIVRLARPAAGEWRGTLAPANRDRWFRNYADVLGDLAAVAAQTGVTRLVIGSELSTLDNDLPHWRPLLERIRAIFGGHLVYSANWDHYQDAHLFDLVDEDGVVGYFNLRANGGAPSTDAVLDASWTRHKEDLLRWHDGNPHPLLFTEVGYRSRVGSTAGPWDETPGGTFDAEEQRRGFASFRRVWAGNAALDGAYIWNWYGWGGDGSVGYTPRGKPAEEEARRVLESL